MKLLIGGLAAFYFGTYLSDLGYGVMTKEYWVLSGLLLVMLVCFND